MALTTTATDCRPTARDTQPGGDCGGAIDFITGDTINGPLYSEDDLAVSGSPTFGSTGADQIDTPGCDTSSSSTPSAANCGSNVVGTLDTTPPDTASRRAMRSSR